MTDEASKAAEAYRDAVASWLHDVANFYTKLGQKGRLPSGQRLMYAAACGAVECLACMLGFESTNTEDARELKNMIAKLKVEGFPPAPVLRKGSN